MVCNSSKDDTEEIHNGVESTNYPNLTENRIGIPSLQERLLHERSHKQRLLDFLKATPSSDWLKRLKLPSPLKYLQQTVDERENVSISVPSPLGVPHNLHINFIRIINWVFLFNSFKEWLKNPLNIALLIWSVCVAASATMSGLLLLELLNQAFPTKSSRNHWIEINTQVLNALFTLMSLYQHPKLFYHFALLCRWRAEDIIELRKVYCKNTAYRPREWAHMMVVLVLLHITFFAQYALCGLYWGYSSTQRPEIAETYFFILGTASPIFAALYTVYSPLGREYDSDPERKAQDEILDADASGSNKHFLKLYERRLMVGEPEWVGGLFDCSEDITLGFYSFFCTCCVFGWNMERIGFGNMYVHMFTFLLLCFAPFWIFNISALNIRDYILGDIVGDAGVILCFFGLIYGGYWRIQMRKKYKLPGNSFCCGSASVTDYMQWMFCWSCSLAQEVRTANFYDAKDERSSRNLQDGDEESLTITSEMTNSTSIEEVISSPEMDSKSALDDAMIPPAQPIIQLEDRVVDSHTIVPLPCSTSRTINIGDNSSTSSGED
ncbi:uncharacterized protein [Typha latifolia]|uniref:uncharacterized protein n=1 Tax=Typha latifolia TaxID=4733 RepID=UPI003C2D91E7